MYNDEDFPFGDIDTTKTSHVRLKEIVQIMEDIDSQLTQGYDVYILDAKKQTSFKASYMAIDLLGQIHAVDIDGDSLCIIEMAVYCNGVIMYDSIPECAEALTSESIR